MAKKKKLLWKLKGCTYGGKEVRWAQLHDNIIIIYRFSKDNIIFKEIKKYELADDTYLLVGNKYFTLGDKIKYIDAT